MTLNRSVAPWISLFFAQGLLLPQMVFGETQTTDQPKEFKSPYFIDGIHCEGVDQIQHFKNLRMADGIVSFKDQFTDESTWNSAMKLMEQEACDEIFLKYGVAKFQYVTSDDLENLTTVIRLSQKFESFELQMVKSEQKNHVHLIGRFKYREKESFSLNHQTVIENSFSSGKRETHYTGVSYENNAFVTALNHYESSAKKVLDLNQVKGNSDDETIPAEDLKSMDRRYWTYLQMELSLQLRPDYGRFPTKLSYGVNYSKTNEEHSYVGDTYGRLDVEIPSFIRLSSQKNSIGLLVTEHITGKENYEKDGKIRTRFSHSSIAFLGIDFRTNTQKLLSKLSFYRSLSKEMYYFAAMDFGFRFSQMLNMDHFWGVTGERIENAILHQHRFKHSNYVKSGIYYRVNKDLDLGLLDLIGNLKIGHNTISVTDLKSVPAWGQNFIEVGLTSKRATSDNSNLIIGLSFVYADERLY